jgi:hypothetical protein
LRGPTLIGLHYRPQGRAKHAKPKTLLIANCRLPSVDLPALTTIGFSHEREAFHTESIGPVSIEQSWGTDIFLAD